MRIVITGIAGFIGFHLAKTLASEGHSIIGIDNLNSYYDVGLKKDRLKELGFVNTDTTSQSSNLDIHFSNFDINDQTKLNKLFKAKKPDHICHLAAQAGVRYSITHPQKYIESNISGFLSILESCRKNDIQELTYASSSSVYGLNTNIPLSTRDNTDHPVSLYAASKKSNEVMAHAYSHLYGIRSTGLRFFTVYGPWGRPDMALFIFTKAAFEKESIDVFNHGNMLRDFTYIDDIIFGIKKVINNPPQINPDWDSSLKLDISSSSAPHKIYNIGNNNPSDLSNFISIIEDKIGIKISKKFHDLQMGDVQKTFANVDDLVNDFDYQPQTKLEEGIEKFIEWYKSYYEIR